MGIPVRARNTILRSGVEILPGTVFEMPTQRDADHLIQMGVVTPYLDQPIAATPEYEITESGTVREISPEEGALGGESEAPPASFADEVSALPPAERPRGKRR